MSSTADQSPPETHEDVIKKFLEAMKKKDGDSVEGLKQAFNVLSKGQEYAQVSADDLHCGIENRGLKLALEEVKERILHVKKKDKYEDQYQINREEFINIVKSLEEPTVEDQLTNIYGILCKEESRRIVLYGESGVGKTWMAKKLAGHAIRQGKFKAATWVYLNRKYDNESLKKSIDYQLSAIREAEAKEAKKKEELEKGKAKQDEVEGAKDKAKQTKDKAKQKEQKEQKDKAKPEAHEGAKEEKTEKQDRKRLLLILDDEGSKMKLDKSKENRLLLDGIDLGEMLPLEPKSYQVLITSKDQPAAVEDIGIKVRPLTQDESKKLAFHEMGGAESWGDEIKGLVDFFIGKSKRLPAQILIIAKVMSYLGKTESGLQKLRSYREVLEKGTDLEVENLLIMGYDRLPISVLIDCYSTETRDEHFLHRGGMVNFNELICYWIMEGHLGHFDRIKDAYKEGHRVLMELMNCGLLWKQEADYVTPSGARFKLDIHDHDEFFRKSHPGLAMTFDMKLGKVALADGMIKTVSSSGQEDEKLKLSTLLLDGNHIGDELPANSIDDSKDVLENLAIFNPTCKHFGLPIHEMQKLRLLVLRGCQFLGSIKNKASQKSDSFRSNPSPSSSLVISEKFDHLTVLVISGPSFLKKIPDDLFQNMPQLKTLNMSYLHQIELLPTSFYRLGKIEFLILRGCSKLHELGSLETFKGLQVLDVSEATSFEKFHDKNLKENSKLRILNLSKTRIKTLPIINSNQELKFISLSDCKDLQRIRMISRLRNLQIFDISGAILVEEFCDPSLEELKNLVILDVSRTAIRRLPSNISKPRYLYLKDCSNLKRVPPIEGLSGVEVIDLSGSRNLEEIRTEFFKEVRGLRELNLSKTGVKHLPFLSSLGTLRRLVLSQCKNLEELENLSSLEELEFLDLSGCSALKEIKDGSFDKMYHLYYLALSGILLDRLPSLSKLKMLKKLYVRDCPNLIELPGIEEVEVLEILDYSGTPLKSTPSFSKPDCHPRLIGASMDNIDYQELLKKLGANTAAEVTSDKSELIDITRDDLRQCKWSISNWQVGGNVYKKTVDEPVHGVQFLQLLKEYPSLLTKNLSRFHFLVYPSEAETKLPDEYGSELSLRDIDFEQVSQEKLERRLEIREFDKFPPSLGHLLKQAQFVVLVDNLFLKSLLDLGVDNIIAMRACWIESCNELDHIIKVEDSDKSGESAESKGNAGEKKAESKGDTGEKKEESKGDTREKAERKDDTGEKEAENKGDAGEKKAESKGDTGEKEAENKGDAGEKKAESKGDTGEKKAESKGGIGDLAERKRDTGEKKAESKGDTGEKAQGKGDIGELAESKGDTGEKAGGKGDTGEKPKGKGDTGESAESKGDTGEKAESKGTGEKAESKGGDTGEKAESNGGDTGEKAESKGEIGKNVTDIVKNIEILRISHAMNLGSISNGDIQSISFKGLKSLYLEYCPQLSMICSSPLQLESLEVLDVKHCQNLRTLFADDSAQLQNLKELHLWGLEKLKNIACKVPSLITLRVGECPLLEHVIHALFEGNEHLENVGHGNLKVLHIKFCDKLKDICESSQGDVAVFSKLEELELSALPELKKITCSTECLKSLKVSECPSLQHIVCSNVKNLETLEVKYCDELMTISIDGGLDLGKVNKMLLLSLPELDNINGAKFPPSSQEHCMILGCPKLQESRSEQANVEEYSSIK